MKNSVNSHNGIFCGSHINDTNYVKPRMLNVENINTETLINLSSVSFMCDQSNRPVSSSYIKVDYVVDTAVHDQSRIEPTNLPSEKSPENVNSYEMNRAVYETNHDSGFVSIDNVNIGSKNMLPIQLLSNNQHFDNCGKAVSNENNQFVRDINNTINSQRFWSTYKISKSIGDGHCLIHSIISSMNSQHSTKLDHSFIVRMIEHEAESNDSRYLPAIEGCSRDVLRQQMKAYLNEKVYDSSFGMLCL